MRNEAGITISWTLARWLEMKIAGSSFYEIGTIRVQSGGLGLNKKVRNRSRSDSSILLWVHTSMDPKIK
jgi:hypothetical protein